MRVPFFSFRADSVIGKAARLPLRVLPPGTVVPILATAARGRKWIIGSGPHSNWLGFNERSKRRLFTRAVVPGSVVYDVGANVGSYTILASMLVGPEGLVVAFEPVDENVQYLRRHVEINNLVNVRIVPGAVSDVNGSVSFDRTTDRVLGRIDPAGADRVSCVSLDAYTSTESRAPACIKIDVEGGEVAVLEGARRLLQSARPLVFVATHGEAAAAECRAILAELGYSVAHLPGHPDELIAEHVLPEERWKRIYRR